uniref:Guanylate-binding protein/Atlastin C-terminal domain-containing protein n=1 Tax=Anguilla anguilla TaxID=7936 RepID=A0A0E9WI84_ANGAN
MSRKHCAALLLQLEQVMDMDPEEAYMKPGGYQRFKDHLNNLVKLYRNKPSKGVKAEEALEDYLREKNGMGKIILTVDKNMSEQQRRLEEQRAQLEEEEQRAAAAREKQEALERRVNDIERARQENERQLMNKMVMLQAVLQAENETAMDQKLREQRDQWEEGYNRKAERWDEEIRQMWKEIASQKRTREVGGCFLS